MAAGAPAVPTVPALTSVIVAGSRCFLIAPLTSSRVIAFTRAGYSSTNSSGMPRFSIARIVPAMPELVARPTW